MMVGLSNKIQKIVSKLWYLSIFQKDREFQVPTAKNLKKKKLKQEH